MLHAVAVRLKRLTARQRAGVVAVVLVVVAVVLYAVWPPQRSEAAFCKLYKTESAKFDNGSYSSSDYARYAAIYSKLERVAPNDIRPDVKVMRQVLQKMDKDPSQVFSAGLSGLGAETNVKEWTASHCKV